jgi:hypothetical protein
VASTLLRALAYSFEDPFSTRQQLDPEIFAMPEFRAPLNVEDRIARFFSPPEFPWTPEVAEIEAIVQNFSRSVYADR